MLVDVATWLQHYIATRQPNCNEWREVDEAKTLLEKITGTP